MEQQQQYDLMEIIEDRHGRASTFIASQKEKTSRGVTETKHKDNKHFFGKFNGSGYYFNYEQDAGTTVWLTQKSMGELFGEKLDKKK